MRLKAGSRGVVVTLVTAVLTLLTIVSRVEADTSVEIAVTTTADVVNGDVSLVQALVANPGPDGISLREALKVTNTIPGAYTIRFASSLSGQTIALTSNLPVLVGGGVTVNGEIGGQPGITITPGPNFQIGVAPGNCNSKFNMGCGFVIGSSNNSIKYMQLTGFSIGILVMPWDPTGLNSLESVSHKTIANTLIHGNVMKNLGVNGVAISSSQPKDVKSDSCGFWAKPASICWTYNTWSNTSITDNLIDIPYSGGSGQAVVSSPGNGGDVVKGLSITGNTLSNQGLDVAIQIINGGYSKNQSQSEILIQKNKISGGWGIEIAGGAGRTQDSSISNVQILDNQLNLMPLTGKCDSSWNSCKAQSYCCSGIKMSAATDNWGGLADSIAPDSQPSRNSLRNVVVRGNTITGQLIQGISISSGVTGGSSDNVVDGVLIEHNSIKSSTIGTGIHILNYGDSQTTSPNNSITNVNVLANRIEIGNIEGAERNVDGAIVVNAGSQLVVNSRVTNVSIMNNITGPGNAAISLIGGSFRAEGNVLSKVQVINNSVDSLSGIAFQLIPNKDGGKNNTISGLIVSNSIFVGRFTGDVTPPMVRSSITSAMGFKGINGNIQADPKFVNPLKGDYHLSSDSPAISTGTSEAAPANDFDGYPRTPGRIDMGAYAFTGVAIPHPSKTTSVVTPTAVKTITCVKGKLRKIIKGKSPTCPKGYTKK